MMSMLNNVLQKWYLPQGFGGWSFPTRVSFCGVLACVSVEQIANVLQIWNAFSSWWFQPHWKILVKMGIFPKTTTSILVWAKTQTWWNLPSENHSTSTSKEPQNLVWNNPISNHEMTRDGQVLCKFTVFWCILTLDHKGNTGFLETATGVSWRCLHVVITWCSYLDVSSWKDSGLGLKKSQWTW